MTGTTAAIVWLILAIILFVVEGVTVQLVCIWFAAGSLVAMIASFFGAPFIVQLALFIVTSLAVLYFARPLVKKSLTPKKTATNADMVIGKTGVVLEEINNTLQVGRVSANGLDWSARSEDDSVISVHTQVTVLAIDGVKLIVKPLG